MPGMGGILAAVIGFIGILLSAVLVWKRSAIRTLLSEMNSRFEVQR